MNLYKFYFRLKYEKSEPFSLIARDKKQALERAEKYAKSKESEGVEILDVVLADILLAK